MGPDPLSQTFCPTPLSIIGGWDRELGQKIWDRGSQTHKYPLALPIPQKHSETSSFWKTNAIPKTKAMSRSAVELDFFQMERESAAKPQPPKKLFDRRRNFRDIQSVISKMNPEILKSVIATGSVENGNLFASKPKNDDPFLSPALPPLSTPAFGNRVSGTSPVTIFYNGTISVFDVSPDKAESILKLAEENVSKTVDSDLPLTRRKSLQRFMQKRKERLTMASPYGNCPTNYALSGEKKSPYGNWPIDNAFSGEKKSPYGNWPTDNAFSGQKNSSGH